MFAKPKIILSWPNMGKIIDKLEIYDIREILWEARTSKSTPRPW